MGQKHKRGGERKQSVNQQNTEITQSEQQRKDQRQTKEQAPGICGTIKKKILQLCHQRPRRKGERWAKTFSSAKRSVNLNFYIQRKYGSGMKE